jgi:hypothetical protein
VGLLKQATAEAKSSGPFQRCRPLFVGEGETGELRALIGVEKVRSPFNRSSHGIVLFLGPKERSLRRVPSYPFENSLILENLSLLIRVGNIAETRCNTAVKRSIIVSEALKSQFSL